MGAFVATTCSNVMIDWLTGRTTPAAAATRYLSIWDGDPQAAGSEVTATVTGSATRPSVGFNAASSGSASSSGTVSFTTNAAGSATVDHLGLHSGSTGTGNLLSSAAVVSKSMTLGDSLSCPAGSCTVSIS